MEKNSKNEAFLKRSLRISQSYPDIKTLRLLDANLNRAREGLRVLEDTARFKWSNKSLFLRFRKERHLLDMITRRFYPELLRSRNSGEDDGRSLKEGKRENIGSIVVANFRRCEESLRVLEEYGKIFPGRADSQFKKIRFRIYDLEKICAGNLKLKTKFR